MQLLTVDYYGDVDPSQEAAAIAQLLDYIKGIEGAKPVKRKPLKPAPGLGESCRFVGPFRVLRFFNTGPLEPCSEWINRVDIGLEQVGKAKQ